MNRYYTLNLNSTLVMLLTPWGVSRVSRLERDTGDGESHSRRFLAGLISIIFKESSDEKAEKAFKMGISPKKNRKATGGNLADYSINSSSFKRLRINLSSRRVVGNARHPSPVIIIPSFLIFNKNVTSYGTETALLICLQLWYRLGNGASNSSVSGYRTRQICGFFTPFFRYGRGAPSVRTCVALTRYLKPLLPENWLEHSNKCKGANMPKNKYLHLSKDKKHRATLLALRSYTYSIAEWLEALELVIKHNDNVTPEFIIKMLGLIANENYTAIVGINERLNGWTDDQDHAGRFLNAEIEAYAKLSNRIRRSK